MCRWGIEFPARSDKEYCSDACRSLHWQRKNQVPVHAFTVEDFAEVQEVITRNEERIKSHGRKAKLIGYSLRALPKGKAARLGEVSFPDPNRKTKRFPDESGVARVRREPYFRYAPFEPARVPRVGVYAVALHWDDGYVGTIGDHVVVKRAFPSVPYYDQEGNRYDLKGRLIPTGKSATPKARRKYVPRKQSMVPVDSVLPVEPTMLEYVRVAVARAVQAEREADRLRVATPQPPKDSDQAASLQALAEQVAMLTTKLNAAEARAVQAERDAKEALARAEARAVRAEALLSQDAQRSSLKAQNHMLEAQVRNAAERVEKVEEERFQLAQRVRVLERSLQQQQSVVSAPTGATVAAPPAAIQPDVPAQTTTPAPAPPAAAKATVFIEQSAPKAPPGTVFIGQPVNRVAGQAANPAPRTPLRRKTLAAVLDLGRTGNGR
jgi:hypothetical protein